MKREFTVARGLKVEVVFRDAPGPSWLGGPLKWSATPVWAKRAHLKSGYRLPHSGHAHEVEEVLTSVTGSVTGWLTHLTGKARKEVIAHQGFTQFVEQLDEWLNGGAI